MPTTRIPYGVLDGRYVNAAGDTMLGELTLAGAPTLDLHAATKEYVDDAVGLGGHTHTLDAGATDVTATAAEVNLLDLSGLSTGQVLRATGAASAAWGSIQAGDLPTGIDAAKIADGSVSNTEYQYLNGVTSAVQTQLDAKATESIVLKKDGSVALTSDWDIGDTRKILADGIRARDAAGLELYDDGGNGVFIEDGGQVGIGTNSPEAPLNVYLGSAGTVSPNASADDVVIESSDDVGISLLAPDDKMAGLYMGSPQSNQGMRLYYYPTVHGISLQETGTSILEYHPGDMVFNENGADMDWRIETAVSIGGIFLRGSDGLVGINTVAPGRRLDALDSSNPQLRLTHTTGSVYTDFQTSAAGNLLIHPTGFIRLISYKDTGGDPTGAEGMIYFNTADKVVKMYADGGWRTLASW